MQDVYSVILACFGTVLALLAIIGTVRRSLPASGPLFATLAGLVFGPVGINLISLDDVTSEHRALLEEAARITLAIAVMTTALRISGHSARLLRAMAALLVIAMPCMWLVSATLSYWIMGLSVPVAILAGAIVAPTDPVISGSIFSGDFARKHVPARLRHLLSAEAGANDGLGLIFVMAPILWLTKSPGAALEEWILRVVLWEVVAGAVIGWLLGDVTGRLVRHAREKEFTADVSVLAVTIALALAVLGLMRVLHADGILGVFVAGLAFSRVSHPRQEIRAERTQEAVRTLLELPVFVLFGLAIPFQEWVTLGWSGLLFCAAILLLRRVPCMFLAAPATGFFRNSREIIFGGFFGPIGIAAMFYVLFAEREIPSLSLWPVISLVIMSSIVMHGALATFVSVRLKD